MVIAGGIIMFFALISWSLWGLLYSSSKRQREWQRVRARIVQHEVDGKRYKPIVEFEYEGELVRCRSDYITDKKGIQEMPIDSFIDISYCRDIIGRRRIDFGNIFYSGIVRVERPDIKIKNEVSSRRLDNSILAISAVLTLASLTFIFIGILN